MKNVIKLMLIMTITISAWEINTHRAIERKAIEVSENLKTFVKNSGISASQTFYDFEQFEGYNKTYIKYIEEGETNGISTSKWKQDFSNINLPSYQKMIEAGSILEDAQWQHFLDGGQYNYFDKAHGRFVNHFYDAQNNGHALTYGAFLRTDALHWALGSRIYAGNYGGQSTYVSSPNIYTYSKALNYFFKGFTEANPSERRKYQAKMFVALGHLLHLMNDLTSPAHTRDDSHPFGDAMEEWGRGGEDGKQNMGYKIVGNSLDDDAGIIENKATYMPKYSKFSDFITKEATWTATHFFSNDTIYTKPRPSRSDTYEFIDSVDDGVTQYYIKSDGTGNVGCHNGCVPVGTKLAIGIKSWIINKLDLYYPERVVGKTTTFKGDYSVLKENAKILIPRAIANARNFTNYFFRGQISAKIDEREDGYYIIIKNISDPSLVKNVNDVTFNTPMHNGNSPFYLQPTVEFKYDSGNGVWKDLLSSPEYDHAYATRKLSNPLAPGESITFFLKRHGSVYQKDMKIIVIIDGFIGSEPGVAVCTVENSGIWGHRE